MWAVVGAFKRTEGGVVGARDDGAEVELLAIWGDDRFGAGGDFKAGPEGGDEDDGWWHAVTSQAGDRRRDGGSGAGREFAHGDGGGVVGTSTGRDDGRCRVIVGAGKADDVAWFGADRPDGGDLQTRADEDGEAAVRWYRPFDAARLVDLGDASAHGGDAGEWHVGAGLRGDGAKGVGETVFVLVGASGVRVVAPFAHDQFVALRRGKGGKEVWMEVAQGAS